MMKKNNIFYIIIIVAIAVFLFIKRQDTTTMKTELAKNGIVTIGKITERGFPARISTSGYSYGYIYYVENTKFTSWGLENKKYPIGTYFKVVYLPDKPEESRMDFSKPIPDDSVFIYFENECPFK